MKHITLLTVVLAAAVSVSACGGKKAASTVTLEEARAGRDAELFHEAVDRIRKGRYDEGRILMNTMVNTYPESPLVRAAKLATGDSFFLAGGSKNLAQAEVEYRDWLQFFPDDNLADDVSLKIAEIHLRQVMAPDRDTTHARLAERQLKETVRIYPDSDLKGRAEELMNEAQEILGMHELKVARFYHDIRQAAPATQMRTEEILNKYPNFSRFDEALWLHARAMADQEDTETASEDLTRLIVNYPHSEFRAKAEELLTRWGKPIPEPDPAKLSEPPANGKGLPGRFLGVLFGPKINTSSKGVIVDRDLTTDELVARARELVGAPAVGGAVVPGAATTTNVPGARPRRASGAGQDVEVRPGSSPTEKPKDESSKDGSKDKAKKDNKRKDN